MSGSLPFTILGGYLGAGKTTVLNALLRGAHGLRLAVVVNDFGSVNIDAELIRRHDGETISLANGCVCCSLVDGFATTIARIQEHAADFDHIVIEASGVSDPSKIANYGKAFQLGLDGVIVVCDAERASTLVADRFVGGTVKRQLANADLILLNKTDLAGSDELARVRTLLANLAPGTPVVESVRGNVPFEVVLGVHRDRDREPAGVIPGESAPEHTGAYATWIVERDAPVSREALERFASSLDEHIYRAKGIVALMEDTTRRFVYQQAGSRWSLERGEPWGEEPRRTRIVVIGRAGSARPLL